MNEEQALALVQKDLQVVTQASAQPAFTLTGDNGTQIGNVNTLNQNIEIVVNTSEGQTSSFVPVMPLRTDFYHLFVVKGFDPNLPYFTIERKRALTEDMSPRSPGQLPHLDAVAIARIMEYPALFMDENQEDDKPGHQQIAYLGYVTEIKNDSQIRIYHKFCAALPQLSIHRLAEELQIVRVSRGGEMHRTHWALKEADLHAVLYQAGLIGQDEVGRRDRA